MGHPGTQHRRQGSRLETTEHPVPGVLPLLRLGTKSFRLEIVRDAQMISGEPHAKIGPDSFKMLVEKLQFSIKACF